MRPEIRLEEVTPSLEAGSWAGAEQARRGYFNNLLFYMIAGMAQATLAAVFVLIGQDRGFRPVLFLTLLWVHSWPMLLTLLVLWGRDIRIRTAACAAYFAGLLVIAAFAQSSPVTTGGMTFSPIGQFFFMWAGTMLVPTLLVWCLLRRKVRAAGPLVLISCLCAMIGVQAALMILDQDYAQSALLRLLLHIPIGVYSTMISVVLLCILLLTPVGWLIGRGIGRLYGNKLINDQTLTIDALWLTFSAIESIFLVMSSGLAVGLMQGVSLFLIYRIVYTVLSKFGSKKVSGMSARQLLLLRVFRTDLGSERLMDVFGSRWRHGGCIHLIGGTDLATVNVTPNQFLDFVRGRLASHFVFDEAGVDRRLRELDLNRDIDGRYRINELFCQGDSWRMGVKRLAQMSEAVLMDLRGFDKERRGCRYELSVLVGAVPLDRVTLIVDRSTNLDDLKDAIQEAWGSTSDSGVNAQCSSPVVRALAIQNSDSKACALIMQSFK